MSREAFAEALQCHGIVLLQGIDQSAQLLMVCQCVLNQWLCCCAVQQQWQQRLFLELEVWLQRIRECMDYALASLTHQNPIA